MPHIENFASCSGSSLDWVEDCHAEDRLWELDRPEVQRVNADLKDPVKARLKCSATGDIVQALSKVAFQGADLRSLHLRADSSTHGLDPSAESSIGSVAVKAPPHAADDSHNKFRH